jgi:hypothetical protein
VLATLPIGLLCAASRAACSTCARGCCLGKALDARRPPLSRPAAHNVTG